MLEIKTPVTIFQILNITEESYKKIMEALYSPEKLSYLVQYSDDFVNILDVVNKKDSIDGQLPTLNLKELEKIAIQSALRVSRGNQSQAAKILGINQRKINYAIHHVHKINDYAWRKNKTEIKDAENE